MCSHLFDKGVGGLLGSLGGDILGGVLSLAFPELGIPLALGMAGGGALGGAIGSAASGGKLGEDLLSAVGGGLDRGVADHQEPPRLHVAAIGREGPGLQHLLDQLGRDRIVGHHARRDQPPAGTV